MKFAQAIKKGITGIQSAYSRQKKAAEDRAKRRLAAAKTKYKKERIKAELEREKLQLQREMYEAKSAVRREREAVARAKTAAGVVGFRERAGGFVSTARKGYRRLQRELYGSPPKRRKVGAKMKITTRR